LLHGVGREKAWNSQTHVVRIRDTDIDPDADCAVAGRGKEEEARPHSKCSVVPPGYSRGAKYLDEFPGVVEH